MDQNDLYAFIAAFDIQRLHAFLDLWLMDHTIDDIHALCVFLGYDPIAELAAFHQMRLGRDKEPPIA
jgi:hypothetical protein